ncbi:MAG: ATP-dependent 6-phosphofructokinase [Chitinispirillales bacterium]|jgi:6-phosphofructokinase 1|nr:ATP-dependent 6-phosphofructokinase [Chitinispirillales bacterium]
MKKEFDFTISNLGPCKVAPPILLSKLCKRTGDLTNYVRNDEYIVYDIEASPGDHVTFNRKHLIEKAGPRGLIFFNPEEVHAAIVTCGGLCPGLNDVIRALVMALWYEYGVLRISGIPFGYRGFLPEFNHDLIPLKPDVVKDIHRQGGTYLGSSRGYGDNISQIVDTMEKHGINVLFTVGGDGTQRGSLRIAEEVERRGLNAAVVGIPKTIDNDLSFIEKSFGFETAVSEAANALNGAHVEASCAVNGVGLVKVMGRESGFIAAYTALGTRDANFVLVPEVPFDLDGENGLLAYLHKRLIRRNHAVIVVAEGAGQEHLEAASTEFDASGNKKLGDIGLFLQDKIRSYFKEINVEVNLKYIDPSYMIRATPANPIDSTYCARLGTYAVHAAMAGKTKMLVSHVNDFYVHIPTELAISERNRIKPSESLWRNVIEATGQPASMKN